MTIKHMLHPVIKLLMSLLPFIFLLTNGRLRMIIKVLFKDSLPLTPHLPVVLDSKTVRFLSICQHWTLPAWISPTWCAMPLQMILSQSHGNHRTNQNLPGQSPMFGSTLQKKNNL